MSLQLAIAEISQGNSGAVFVNGTHARQEGARKSIVRGNWLREGEGCIVLASVISTDWCSRSS